MKALPQTTAQRWRFALKPASWPKLGVPALLGQGLGVAASGGLDWGALAFGVSFTLLDLVFIVLLNDWGDREVDSLKRRMFPNAGSPKTIHDGVLSALHLLVVGSAAGLLAALLSVAAALLLERPALAWAGPASLAIFVFYTLPPLKLNYRGGGELLECAGVGVVLPWLNAYAQAGVSSFGELWALPGFAALALASAVASGLSDEQSDRRGGKRTVASLLGNRAARRTAEIAAVVGAGLWLVLASGPLSPWVVIPAAAIVVAELWPLRQLSEQAVTNAFPAQGRYKAQLHRAIWRGGAVLGLLAALRGLLA